MKKLILGLLAFVMMFALVACGNIAVDNTEQPTNAPVVPERVLEVGYGKACITPTEPVEMYGGWYAGKLDDLYVITMAFKDEEGNTYIHVVTDMNWATVSDTVPENSLDVCDMVREAAGKELSISPYHLTVGGTHSHSSVAASSQNPANERWRQQIFIPQVLASIQQAIDDLSPADMYIARTETQNLTFVRRYWLSDGTLYDGMTVDRDLEIVSHETEADEEIQLVKFVREGKEDVLMINWQTHATSVSAAGKEVSSDYVGALRDKVEAELSVKCVFYQGACGNLVHTSRIPGEATIPSTGRDAAQSLGKAVAAYVVDAYKTEKFVPVKTGLIQMKRIVVNGEVKKYSQEMVDNAKKVILYGDVISDDVAVAEYAAQFGIQSRQHAEAIVATSLIGNIKTYELNVISIGDVAFTTLPMEFFDTTGMQIKEGSPFEMTILLGYSCGKARYAADKEAYSHGGYETYNTFFVPGTAEIAVDHYLNALNELYAIRFESK